MGGIRSVLVKSILDPLIQRIRQRIYYMERLDKEKSSRKLLDKLQSKGFNLRLNGDNHVITLPKNTIIGNNVHIGNNAYFSTEGGLIIGDNTHISRNVTIFTQSHNYSGDQIPYDQTSIYKPVTIHNNVWIGMNVSIIPGVTIGEGAIIGLGTLVNRNVEPFEIVGNVKATSLKFRDENHYKSLLKASKFGGINGKLIDENQLKDYLPTYSSRRDNKLVFILSTGRSGSKAIVDILNTHSECVAYHEDIHQLIRLSTKFAHERDFNSIEKELASIFQYKVIPNGQKVIIHSDQRLWNLVPFLSTYFPNSRFIHLKRDAVPSVISMISRNWYKDGEYPKFNKHDWAKYRLNGSLTGEVDEITWKNWSPLEKCCWYWCHVNNTIKLRLLDLDPKRVLTTNIEQIDEELLRIQEFIGVKTENLKPKVSNKTLTKHFHNYNEVNNDENKKLISEFIRLYDE